MKKTTAVIPILTLILVPIVIVANQAVLLNAKVLACIWLLQILELVVGQPARVNVSQPVELHVPVPVMEVRIDKYIYEIRWGS